MQAFGQSGLGLCLHHPLRTDPEHQVWLGPLLSHSNVQDDLVAHSNPIHLELGHVHFDENLQVEIFCKR